MYFLSNRIFYILTIGLSCLTTIGHAGLIEDDRLRWQSFYAEVEPTTLARQWFVPFETTDRHDFHTLKIISVFGDHRDSYYPGHMHTAIDLEPKATAEKLVIVYPVASGVVCSVHLDHPHQTVVVKHRLPNGSLVFSSYKHLHSIDVKNGDTVTWRTRLGRLYTRAETKRFGGRYDHLHLEIRKAFDDYGVASWATMDETALNQRFYNPLTFLASKLNQPIPTVLILNPALDPKDLRLAMPVVEKIQEAFSFHPVFLHYAEFTAEKLKTLSPQGLIIPGQNTPWHLYPSAPLQACQQVLRTVQCPVLGICGGHQLLAMAFGGKVGLIRGKGLPNTYDQCFRHQGEIHTQRLQKDPLLEGLPVDPMFYVSHCEEVKVLPAGFDWLLKGPVARIQMMRAHDRPIYSVQFHPEQEVSGDYNGSRLLENFMGLVLTGRKNQRGPA